MLKDDVLIKVTNRNRGKTGYIIPELNNLQRQFAPSESKQITMGELRKLSWVPGGKNMLKDCLIIDSEDAVKELLGDVDPEYYYKDEDIKKLLTEGSLEQLQDCIDFAPSGVIDLIKQYAVELEINDNSKRDAIAARLGFNVNKAIEAKKEKERSDVDEESRTVRRSEPITATHEPQKYKVTSTAK